MNAPPHTTMRSGNARSELIVFLIASLVWSGALAQIEPPLIVSSFYQLLFVVGVAFLSAYFSVKCGYFDGLRLVPRKSDFVVQLSVAPAAVLMWGTLVLPWDSVPRLFAWSPLIGLLVFVVDYAASTVLLKCGRRRGVVVELMPAERRALVESMIEAEVAEQCDFLSRQDLSDYFAGSLKRTIDLVVISREASAAYNDDALLLRAHLAGIPIVDYTKLVTTVRGRVLPEQICQWSFLHNALPQTLPLRTFAWVKRIIDPLAAFVLGIIMLPVVVVLALLIKSTSEGPVLYRQRRVGLHGRIFTLIKFRSMRTDAEMHGPRWAAADSDDRVTPVGRFMRKCRLDELPQLWNIIKGEMSFIGPRPERPEICERLLSEIPLFNLRTIILPGITGWAQVHAGYAASVAESRTKLEYDLFYIQNLSPRLDLITAFKTIQVALFGEKASQRAKQLQAAGDSFKIPV